MSTPGITFCLLDGGQAAAHSGDVLALHDEAAGQGEDGTEFARRFRVWRRQPGFVLAEARSGGYLAGFAAGMPLRTSTSWWREVTAPLPAAVTAEYPGRTFALTALLVRASWRRQGIGRALHEEILAGRPEERATLTLPPGAAAAQHAFRNWNWQKVARTRGPGPGAPVLDVLVISLPAGRR